jgi:hypothetical protein
MDAIWIASYIRRGASQLQQGRTRAALPGASPLNLQTHIA